MSAAGVRLRRAEPGDVEFLLALVTHEDVEPFLGTRTPKDAASTLEEVERSLREPAAFGRLLLEVARDGGWTRAGALGFRVALAHHGIVRLERLAVHPDFRGRRLADEAARLAVRLLLDELGYHRVELECYAFNERAIRHAERSGFVREGVRRKAYRRHGEWVDGILFGLVREDLDEGPARRGAESAANLSPSQPS